MQEKHRKKPSINHLFNGVDTSVSKLIFQKVTMFLLQGYLCTRQKSSHNFKLYYTRSLWPFHENRQICWFRRKDTCGGERLCQESIWHITMCIGNPETGLIRMKLNPTKHSCVSIIQSVRIMLPKDPGCWVSMWVKAIHRLSGSVNIKVFSWSLLQSTTKSGSWL